MISNEFSDKIAFDFVPIVGGDWGNLQGRLQIISLEIIPFFALLRKKMKSPTLNGPKDGRVAPAAGSVAPGRYVFR